jgi:hypothetical protein
MFYLTGGMDMQSLFFIIIGSLLPLAVLHLFAQSNSSIAQPQSGQAGRGQAQPEDPLLGFSLPAGPIMENDITGIKTTIEQVLGKISELKKPAGKKSDYQTIKSSILTFQDWLKRQGCISQASTTYDLEATDKYSDSIFFTYPGQLPFDIVFKMEGDMKKPYRLLVFVTPADLFNFGSLVENKTIDGVPALKNWPSDYLEKRPES